MRIAVLGGGNGSYAAAADLSEAGHEVAFWRRDTEALKPIIENGTIVLKDSDGRREIKIAQPCTNIADAVRGAALIVVPTPAFAQEDIAYAMAAYLEDGQVIFLPPGSFGSFAMMRVLRRTGCKADITLGETGTLPHLTRKHGVSEVAITVRATRLPTGVFPVKNAEHAFRVLRTAFPSVEPVEDALSGALMNAGPIIHPPLILMNAGPLEHFESWDIHNEGTQPAIRRVTDALDNERIILREALGYGPPHFPLSDHYNNDRWMYGNAHKRLVDSGDWRENVDLLKHRYMVEDIHYGLAFLVSVAHWAGVTVPIAQGLLAVASAICSKDLRKGTRTLEALGLADLNRKQLHELLHEGLPV
ncbi:MAG: NAD/NADP octopine/nopaline dehydrogenase family protein [Zoogloeaceae bacterium]|jgi:opine dehydrogenase|nr:NAD/NADP octopine/nopaline dehydrogenase family protein [Zoogloeaceae bacterium]